MKQFYLRTLLLAIFSLAGITSYAYDCKIDGIYYNLNSNTKTAEVTYYRYYSSYNNYISGDITIPTSITYSGVTYSVTSIGNYAFYDCGGLTSVNIPSSVTSIGGNAFKGCSGLKKVIVQDLAAWCSISFGNEYSNPLYYAQHLYKDPETEITELVIPNSVTTIGNDAFENCSSLTSVTIPNSVTSIGNGAFSGCSGLKKVIVQDLAAWCSINFGNYYSNPLYYAHHLYKDMETEITELVIPNSVTTIGNYAFDGCSGLTSVNIPNSVTTIGEYNQEIKGKTNVEIIPVSA